VNFKETYFALSSPPGISAVASIRISGPRALKCICSLSGKKKSFFKKNRVSVLNIYNKNNCLLDKCVVLFFKKPNSYTGEDVVEINTHGNPIIVSELFSHMVSLGLRLADPGEFTKDAYLNNKLDLIQAESVAAIIQSKSQDAISMSLVGTEGNLSKEFKKIRLSLITILGHIEYELDISETDQTKKTIQHASLELKKVLKNINLLIKSYQEFSHKNRGARVSIVGPTNVGKSTLFNALLNKNRSIVSNNPGTTRDSIDSDVFIEGTPIVLVDTAGIRYSKDSVEKQGIIKTKNEIKKADFVLSVADIQLIKNLNPSQKKNTLFLLNKIDTITKNKLSRLKRKFPLAHFISAKKRLGIRALKKLLAQKFLKKINLNKNIFITSERQKNTLVSVRSLIKPYTIKNSYELELAAHDIMQAIKEFDVLLGKTSPDEVLKTVFSNFCVGK